jgi:hypothetical protein
VLAAVTAVVLPACTGAAEWGVGRGVFR